MNPARFVSLLVLLLCPTRGLFAADRVPPYDLWNGEVLSAIRDRSTLEIDLAQHAGYADVFFTSNPSAGWFDSDPPYAKHVGDEIRIHGFLAAPPAGGPYPALVIGHGHGGQADLTLALQVASLGYVALAIDGPRAGQSTGGPRDDNQAWISVDDGPEYGYLYHYGYAGMRALTLLEALAGSPGNPYRIDPASLGVLGASMGGIFTSYINGIDDRVKAAIIIAAAGQWHHAMRFPNSWLYDGLYTGTRDQPYNGNDPLNSIEDIDTDPTAITFLDYFDPIRYAQRQRAPVMVVIGTHDGYFPLTCANQMSLGIGSAGTRPNFEKRLWLIPNAPHGLDTPMGLLRLVQGMSQWLDYAFDRRGRPLATPLVTMSEDAGGLRFDVTLDEPASRLAGAGAVLYAATRVDANAAPIQDFKTYACTLEGDRFVARIPFGDRPAAGDPYRADNVIYFATVTDLPGLPVSSLVSKAGRMIDLSSGFVPGIDPQDGSGATVPVPPPHVDVLSTAASSQPVPDGPAYQGMSLANSTDETIIVRVDARTGEGRLAAAEGLVNPVFMKLAPQSQRIFLAEEWMGAGARALEGSLRFGWSDVRASSLVFRGTMGPAELSEIGPLAAPATSLWLPLAPGQDPAASRKLRIFSGGSPASVTVVFRHSDGSTLQTRSVEVPENGGSDISLPPASQLQQAASAEIQSPAVVSARLEVSGAGDAWSIEARPAPSGTKAFQPHLEWNGLFRTRILLLNPAPRPLAVTLRLRTTAGTQAAPDYRLTMPAFSAADHAIETIFSFPDSSPGAGWLELEGDGGAPVSTALAFDPGSGAAAATTMFPAGEGNWSMPFFIEDDQYYTGLAILNPGDAPISIELSAYDPDGGVISTLPLVLEDRHGRTLLVSQWIPSLPAESTGHITIQASGPVSLLAYFGTDDGVALAAVPFSLLPK
jgi:cephalosporin-C deacetylase-like acetyl esterase